MRQFHHSGKPSNFLYEAVLKEAKRDMKSFPTYFVSVNSTKILKYFVQQYKIFCTASEDQERRKEKSIRDRERTQGETAGEEDEVDWEKAGKERREDTQWSG